MRTTKHILKTDFGVTVELNFDEETGHYACVWDGLPKEIRQELRDKIASHYIPWRNQILNAWGNQTGKKVLVINL
jgi:hypothetical protein